MAKRGITVELDDETIRHLAMLGHPAEVLARLASSTADGVRLPNRPPRDRTDESLQVERDSSDERDTAWRETAEEASDVAVRRSRRRADQAVQTARDDTDRTGQSPSTDGGASSDRERSRADVARDEERSTGDEVLAHERAERGSHVARELTVERGATDKDLAGERSGSDSLIIDQREANARLVVATVRAQELKDEADASRQRAEAGERELRVVAEFRERFIGILGHDLRSPLSSIGLSAAVLLRRGRLDEKDAEVAARIIRSSQRMTRMIAQLLDLTRARLGGGLPIELAPADLGEVCRDIAEELGAPVQLEVEGDVTGSWDKDRLEEVLSNLVGNAVEHGAPGAAVTIKAGADGAEVVLEVSNEGDPIPEEVLPSIFEPFRGARSQAHPASGNLGLGLGLYIVRQIVVAHGGTIEVHSAGGTTTFSIRLPRHPPAQRQETAAVP
jgi:signal transduction histidine kinase